MCIGGLPLTYPVVAVNDIGLGLAASVLALRLITKNAGINLKNRPISAMLISLF